jgi:hypothetical protein
MLLFLAAFNAGYKVSYWMTTSSRNSRKPGNRISKHLIGVGR